jgi:Asp-tRNA(Asn)/Glu-tRNA(Gln) amidotransferase A subunit family amidase
MRHFSKQLFGYGCLCAALLGVAACSPRRIPPVTVEDLMEDRVTLDGVMMKCNQNPAANRDTSDCENARIAIERLASQNVDPTVEKKRQQEFERAREQLRLAQEKQRQLQEASSKVDAYSLPVVPVTPPAAPGGTAP